MTSSVNAAPSPSTSAGQHALCSEDYNPVTGAGDLPLSKPGSTPSFVWGNCCAEQFIQDLDECYQEVVHWKPNLFKLPKGKVGKSFVTELARLYTAYVLASALESVALKAPVVLPLLLQKPSKSSKNRDHISCIERRMPLWLEGELSELLHEGRAIQVRKLKIHSNRFSKLSLARSFAEKMYDGRMKEALETLKGKERGGVLQMNDQVPSATGENQYVRDVLKEKHP